MIQSTLNFEPNCTFIIVDNSPDSTSTRLELNKLAVLLNLEFHASPYINTSKDQSTSMPKLILIDGHGNLGFGGGMNIGINFIKTFFLQEDIQSEVICLINPDVEIIQYDRQSLSNILETNNKKILVGPDYFRADCINDSPYHFYGLFSGLIFKSAKILRKRYLCGACIFFHGSKLDDIKFDDNTFFLYWEEVDLQVNLMKKNWILDNLKNIVIDHETGGTMPSQEYAFREFSKSRYLFFLKNHGNLRLLLIVCFTSLLAFKFLIKFKLKISMNIYHGLWEGFLKGLKNEKV